MGAPLKSFDHLRAHAENVQRTRDRKRNAPHALAELAKNAEACRQMLNAICDHYVECAARGDMGKWEKAATSIVSLMAGQPAARSLRADR